MTYMFNKILTMHAMTDCGYDFGSRFYISLKTIADTLAIIFSPGGRFARTARKKIVEERDIKKCGALQGPALSCLAEWTGLEPATPGVTGRYSNQLNYHSDVGGC